MPIAVACPHCDWKGRVKDELAGKKGKCPTCGELVPIPQPPPKGAPPPVPSAKKSAVDDEPDVVSNWREVLDQDGYPCLTALDGEHALKLLESERPDVVLTDLWMPRIDGMAILTRAIELDPDVVVIMITGHGTVQSAVEAMRGTPGARSSVFYRTRTLPERP